MPSVLVTGASRGFGRELARVFLDRGDVDCLLYDLMGGGVIPW